ncbi:pyrroline-5-carboxylate reductase [Aquamicrobium zhengzhouense]|uniref:Pyrroline-5-carboxylate reductase n=1 Tax=Aquamicrobium zhengzhouense TaxID=2781738 RepID=A0ABS0SCQ1_9HYPH|nr:pyrroline-5-carboxylate reductase [Aquamicrobium zhengzhouense]MBI1621080.1 pyrroline-5-carboxylate reductase [Aquamicrobium zhengzhouense]
MSAKLVLVGCGNMGYAMLEGWLKSGLIRAAETIVVEPAETLRERAAQLGVNALANSGDIAAGAAPQLIIFAVKPQVILDIVPEYARFTSSATYLSVAAGTPIAAFEKLLGDDAPVIRCMPNTPAAIGKGMMVTVANGNVSQDAAAFVRELLATNGEVASVDDEALMDAVTAVSGSGPAYVFHFIECLTAAGEAAGLASETAKLLAMQTVFGAASLAATSGTEPGELRRQVTSPNGTTAAALDVLMGDDRLKKLVAEAVDAARLRSIELGK